MFRANVPNATDICLLTLLTQVSLPEQAATFESKPESVVLSLANAASTEIVASARVTVLLPELEATPALSAM